ncbi:replication-relaxation family protein [Paenibacillus harenae]|uniref:replication-relaxation family protein n=1 Tax=Paenibacillus harenae TaxID=306543 RepID=UPI0035949033
MEAPRTFEVEPKLSGKGLPEPDAFAIWRGAPWYVEIQRSVYTVKQWSEKMNRYEKYYLSGEWERAEWQPSNKKIFPYVWIVGGNRYKFAIRSFNVFQGSVDSLLNRERV